MSQPETITLRKKSRCLNIEFDDGTHSELGFEFLRVNSPSAEVQGHGPGQAVLQVGKKDVGILRVEPVGNYAVKLVFDDGHDTGIYTWKYLYKLAVNREKIWSDYIRAMKENGLSRDRND